MSTIKATIDGNTHEITPEDLNLGEGYALITPEAVPDGYYSKDTFEAKMKDRLSTAVANKEQELLADETFQRKVLNKYNIVLGDDGKPKGLAPEEDIDQIKQKVAEQVSGEYEEKLESLNKEIASRNQAVVESSIMEAVSGNYREDWTKSFDGGKPLAVKHFADRVGVDEDGRPFVKDENGEKMFSGGGVMRPKDYLLDEERFGELLKDKRQRGSGFQANGGSGGVKSFTEEQIENMSDEEYEKNREDILSGNAAVK